METQEGHIFWRAHFSTVTTLESVGLPLFMPKYRVRICQGFAYCPVHNIVLSIWPSGCCWRPSVVPDKLAVWLVNPTHLPEWNSGGHTHVSLFAFRVWHQFYLSHRYSLTLWKISQDSYNLIALYTVLLWFSSLWYMANKTCNDKNNWISRSVTCFWGDRIILQNVQKIVEAL